jgi:hypothetical protein
MAEEYEDVVEFGKRLVEVLRQYFKGYKEYDSEGEHVYELSEPYDNVGFYLITSYSTVGKFMNIMYIKIYHKLYLEAEYKFNINAIDLTINFAVYTRYRYRTFVGHIDSGTLSFENLDIVIKVNADKKAIKILMHE